MQIQIQFIAVAVEDKGKYKQAEVTYKDVVKGQTTSKKLMSFNNPVVYKTMVDAKNGELYTIDMQKNDKGYWDWVAAKISNGLDTTNTNSDTSSTGKAYTVPKSNYETPEERAKKQVYIVRQSSIGAAIATLKSDKKTPTVAEVLSVAKEYEAYVFGDGSARIIPLAELPPNDVTDDIPV